jgi:hypothetical protein
MTFPLRKGPSGPKAPGGGFGAIVRVGFDCTTDFVVYAALGPGTPLPRVMRAGTDPIAIPLTGFTPGNAIAFFYGLTIKDDEENTSVLGTLAPVIDVGSGFQYISDCASRFSTTVEEQIFAMALIQPAANLVTADPVIGLAIWNAGADSVLIPPSIDTPPSFTQNGSGLFVAMEISADSLTQSVPTSLSAYPSS